ncbi:MAG: hypothetical protein J5517_07260 [Eubacterium sp.]|nr:hypothetical protein [Eubacterium sp.]
MRSNEDLMKGILKRKAVYLARKQARRLTGAAAGLITLLIIMLSIVPDVTGNMTQYTVYAMGATILGPKAGGYVIVALLSFTLGIVMTLLIQKHNRLKKLIKKED